MSSNGEVSKWNACLFIRHVCIQSGQASVRINPRFIYFWSTSQSTAADCAHAGGGRGLIYYFCESRALACSLFSPSSFASPLCVCVCVWKTCLFFSSKRSTWYEMDFLIWCKHTSFILNLILEGCQFFIQIEFYDQQNANYTTELVCRQQQKAGPFHA
jgi:hypothetical protein